MLAVGLTGRSVDERAQDSCRNDLDFAGSYPQLIFFKEIKRQSPICIEERVVTCRPISNCSSGSSNDALDFCRSMSSGLCKDGRSVFLVFEKLARLACANCV